MTTYDARDPSCDCSDCWELEEQEEMFEVYGPPHTEDKTDSRYWAKLLRAILAYYRKISTPVCRASVPGDVEGDET